MIFVYAILISFLLPVSVALGIWNTFRRMPGRSWRRALPPLTEAQRVLAEEMRADLTHLSVNIGERNLQRRPQELMDTIQWITKRVRDAGFTPKTYPFPSRGWTVANIEAVIPGSDPKAPCWVIGAHYDTVSGSPGADDNGTAVVAALAMGRRLRESNPRATIRIVFFANEESPYFGTQEHGAIRYVDDVIVDNEIEVAGMFCLETMGFYRDEPNTQHYPKPLNYVYPRTGNFIAFISDLQSRPLLHRTIKEFRRVAKFPSDGAALPYSFRDIARSDHLPFWQKGIPALMITDTANFRTPHYHTPNDKVEYIDFERLARLVEGLTAVTRKLAGCKARVVEK